MSDVLELLLGLANGVHDDLDVAAEAVNEIIDLEQEITRLRAELAELRERLESARESMVESAVHEFSYGTQLDKLRAQVAALEAEVERRKKDCNVLIDHIDDHDRECAGKWVKVAERLPEAWVEVPVFIPGPNPDMQIGFDEVDSLGCWQAVTGATHWLDARMPGEERWECA